MQKTITNMLTVDVEEHYQVSAFKDAISRDNWHKHESRVVQNTQSLLELFASKNLKATFFVLGMVAEKHPELVREIHAAGHEVASHGYSHKLIYEQTPEVFYSETEKSKKILEDIIGTQVYGYRAASYSITEKSLWALDTLIELGFEYDSSIFPVKHDRYGIPNTPTHAYTLERGEGKSITEIPLSTKPMFGYTLPIAGGGYFRLFPYQFTEWALGSINKSQRKPFIFYLHPWEVDAEQPRIKASRLSEFRHYNNLDKCKDRLEKLINKFEFSTVRKVMENTSVTQRVKL